MPVPAHVLDLFATSDDVRPLPGGQGRSVVSGDLVLSPGRDPAVCRWLSPLVARLAISLDERPGRTARDLRIAVPVPARDGSWVVDGWAATRWEPGTRACDDLTVLLATGRLFHAELAVAVPRRPDALDLRDDRWARAERLTFGDPCAARAAADSHPDPDVTRLVTELLAVPEQAEPPGTGPGAEQLVHADLAGNVLLDGRGAPVVIDLSPAWRTPGWAEAVCVLDAVLHLGADPDALAARSSPVERAALARAAVFRLLSDERPDASNYRAALAPLLPGR